MMRIRQRLNRRNSVLWAQIAAAVVFLLLAATTDQTPAVRALGLALAMAAVGLFLVELRGVRPMLAAPQLRMWNMLAVAAALWALAHALEAGALLTPGLAEVGPSLADVFRLAASMAAAVGLASIPGSYEFRFGRLRDLLEIAILLISALVLFWLVIALPAIEVGIGDPASIIWASLPPALELGLLLLAVRLVLLSQDSDRRFYVLLALAFGFRLPAELSFGYRSLTGIEMNLSWLEGGWVLNPLVLLLTLRSSTDSLGTPGDQIRAVSDRLPVRAAAIMPIFFTALIAGFTLMNWWLNGDLAWAGVVATVALSLLLVARQGVIGGQSEMRQFASLVNGAADLAFICDDGGKLWLRNPAMEAALIGRPDDLQSFMVDPDPDKVLQQAAQSGWSGEAIFRRSDSTEFPLALSLRQVADEQSDQSLLAATGHDLTTLKSRELELRQALEEVAEARTALEGLNESLEAEVVARTRALGEAVDRLERANEELKALDRLKTEFVTLVSHELRGPLTNIRSGVELSLKSSQQLPDQVESTLQLVSTETERLVSFVEIILDLSALEAGRFPLTLEPVPVPAITRTVASRFPSDVGGDRIEIDIPEDLPQARADERALMSVLFHLLDNGLKYAPEGPVTVQARTDNGLITIEVEDHGPGIPAADRESVFDRFHRLDSSDAREVYGHGLGLYLSRRLMLAMGGEIAAKAGQVGGACIVLKLPAS